MKQNEIHTRLFDVNGYQVAVYLDDDMACKTINFRTMLKNNDLFDFVFSTVKFEKEIDLCEAQKILAEMDENTVFQEIKNILEMDKK